MTAMSLSEFSEQVGEIIPGIAKELFKQESVGFCKAHITVPQLVVLEMLTREGQMRMTDLARALNVTTAAMTGVVDRLVKCGYVKRSSDTNDRRTINITSTAKGIKIAKGAIDQRKRMFNKMFSLVSQSEREVYLKILKHIKSHLEEQKELVLQ